MHSWGVTRRAACGLAIVGASAVLAVVFAACVGSDPSGVDGAANDGGAATVDGDANAVASGPVYGIFLTSEIFPTNFAANAADGGVQAVADGNCVRLATAAGLPRAERYQAILVAERGDDAALPLLAKIRASDAGAARWCSIGAGSARPSCDLGGLTFANADAIPYGPASGLITNETGAVVASQFNRQRSYFFSGFYIDPSKPLVDTPPRDCDGWSVRADAGTFVDAGVPPFVSTSLGIGNAVARDGGFAWFGETYASCEDSIALPLLCMDLP